MGCSGARGIEQRFCGTMDLRLNHLRKNVTMLIIGITISEMPWNRLIRQDFIISKTHRRHQGVFTIVKYKEYKIGSGIPAVMLTLCMAVCCISGFPDLPTARQAPAKRLRQASRNGSNRRMMPWICAKALRKPVCSVDKTANSHGSLCCRGCFCVGV